ncbi:MAG: aminoacyl-tRNA hydrolase [Nitrospirae bacterium]|nr:aminoacyl-tRNA hydrolase [Nitrospirota bacterium]
MWLISGLGNPGPRYSRTRHNVGFLVVEEVAEVQRITLKEKEGYIIGNGSIGDDRIVLIEPLTFMNRSGTAVRKIAARFFIPPEKIIVIHDDLDLETGRLKIRKKGSSGGHKGVESVIQHIGSNEFVRVKIGIGRDPNIPTEEFVLSKFRREELPLIREAVKKAADAVYSIIEDGIERAMNRFN